MGMAAQIERELISSRTREALARRKAEGVILGNPRLNEARTKGSATITAKAMRAGGGLRRHDPRVDGQGFESKGHCRRNSPRRNIPLPPVVVLGPRPPSPGWSAAWFRHSHLSREPNNYE